MAGRGVWQGRWRRMLRIRGLRVDGFGLGSGWWMGLLMGLGRSVRGDACRFESLMTDPFIRT